MLEGKTVNGRWEPGKINRLLGRQLECGERSWYQRIWDDRSEIKFFLKYQLLRRDWYVEASPIHEKDSSQYRFQYGLYRRQAEKLAYVWTGIAVQRKVPMKIWVERDRPGNHPGIDINVEIE